MKRYAVEKGFIRDVKNMEGFSSYETDEVFENLEEARDYFESQKNRLDDKEYLFLNEEEFDEENEEITDTYVLEEYTFMDLEKETYHNREFDVKEENQTLYIESSNIKFSKTYIELLELYNADELLDEFDMFLENQCIGEKGLDDDERDNLYEKVKNLEVFDLDFVEKTIRDKSVYFSMKKICESIDLSYDRFKNWKQKEYGLSFNELRMILLKMYSIMK